MMKVRLLVSRAGVRYTQQAGDIVEVSSAERERLEAKGHCEAVTGDKPKPKRAKPKADKDKVDEG